MNRAIKRLGLSALHATGVFGALRHLQRDSALVLCYHGVLPGSNDTYDYLSQNFVAAAAFERHLRWLTSRYTLVPLRQIADAFANGTPLPPRAATVTFDDGFANNYHVAFPILRRLGVPATIFLTTGKIGVAGEQLWTERVKRAIYLTHVRTATLATPEPRSYSLETAGRRERAARSVLGQLKRMPPEARDRHLAEIEAACGRPALTPDDRTRYDFMTWDHVRTMADAGIEFGSHTVSHPILSTLDDGTLLRELAESKRTIESQTGRECYAFAYPNGGRGDFSTRDMEMLERVGYRCALSLQGRLNPVGSSRFGLDRVNISRQFDPPLLNARLTGATGAVQQLRSRWRL